MATKKKKEITLDGMVVGGYSKKTGSDLQEMVILSHKVDRMERWILQLAEKAGVQLKA